MDNQKVKTPTKLNINLIDSDTGKITRTEISLARNHESFYDIIYWKAKGLELFDNSKQKIVIFYMGRNVSFMLTSNFIEIFKSDQNAIHYKIIPYDSLFKPNITVSCSNNKYYTVQPTRSTTGKWNVINAITEKLVVDNIIEFECLMCNEKIDIYMSDLQINLLIDFAKLGFFIYVKSDNK